MQGSGTFGVESVLTSVIGEEDTLLIAANGAYGERMGDIARHAGIHYLMYEEDYNKILLLRKKSERSWKTIRRSLMFPWYTVRPLPGILNDIASVAKWSRVRGKTFYRRRYVQLRRGGYPGGGSGDRLYHQQRQ